MTTEVDAATVFRALTNALTQVCGLDAHDITADTRFRELEVDSIGAIEVVVLVADELDARVELPHLVGDWSALTIGELAGNLTRALHSKAEDHPEQSPLPGPSQRRTNPTEDLRRDTSRTNASSS